MLSRSPSLEMIFLGLCILVAAFVIAKAINK